MHGKLIVERSLYNSTITISHKREPLVTKVIARGATIIIIHCSILDLELHYSLGFWNSDSDPLGLSEIPGL